MKVVVSSNVLHRHARPVDVALHDTTEAKRMDQLLAALRSGANPNSHKYEEADTSPARAPS